MQPSISGYVLLAIFLLKSYPSAETCPVNFASMNDLGIGEYVGGSPWVRILAGQRRVTWGVPVGSDSGSSNENMATADGKS